MENKTEILAKLLEDCKYATRHIKPEFKSYYMAIHLVTENVIIQSHGCWKPLGQRVYGGGRCYTHYCSICGKHGYADDAYCPGCGACMQANI